MDGRHSDAGRTSLQSAYHNKKDVQLRFLLIRLKPRKFQNDVQMNTAVDAFAYRVYTKAWVYPLPFSYGEGASRATKIYASLA